MTQFPTSLFTKKRAQFMKEKLCSMADFKEVVITDTCGVSTVYANDGGVILAL